LFSNHSDVVVLPILGVLRARIPRIGVPQLFYYPMTLHPDILLPQ
jgi:hypothetical protein